MEYLLLKPYMPVKKSVGEMQKSGALRIVWLDTEV